MFMNKWLSLFAAASFFFTPSFSFAQEKPEQTLHIDIPVKLEKANVVFNIHELLLFGDLPYDIAHLQILTNNFKEWDVKGQIIGLFHSEAGYVMLDDEAYNNFRHVKTGNPFKAILVDLMKQGVQIELCGATAKANNWVNANLIPGVKVNTNAMVRLIQLSQAGYTQL